MNNEKKSLSAAAWTTIFLLSSIIYLIFTAADPIKTKNFCCCCCFCLLLPVALLSLVPVVLAAIAVYSDGIYWNNVTVTNDKLSFKNKEKKYHTHTLARKIVSDCHDLAYPSSLGGVNQPFFSWIWTSDLKLCCARARLY